MRTGTDTREEDPKDRRDTHWMCVVPSRREECWLTVGVRRCRGPGLRHYYSEDTGETVRQGR